MDEDARLAALFAEVSSDLFTHADPTFQHVAERAVEVVPACDFVGISLRRRRGRLETVAYTSDAAVHCDALQYELDEGPCVSAVWQEDAYLSQDTSTDERWPRWGARVAAEGVGSVLSIKLATATEQLGALNLYAARRHAFGQEDLDLALIYAAHASNAMNSTQLVRGLETALDRRHLIGVAQGILMNRYSLDLDQAFELLRRCSSHANVKLRDIAATVVNGGDLPRLEEARGELGTESDPTPT